MSRDKIAQLAEEQDWLGPAEEPLQHAIRSAFASLGGDKARDLLHGTWLNEPLHAVLTDVPVGSWTAAVAFDAAAALGAPRALDTAADAAILVGAISAVGAAVTGMNDWAEVTGEPRRIGLVHALLNTAGLSLFVTSLVARKRGARTRGRAWAALGYLITAVSAHLGGNLIYEHGVGVGPQEHWRAGSDARQRLSPAHERPEDFTGDANEFERTYGTRDA